MLILPFVLQYLPLRAPVSQAERLGRASFRIAVKDDEPGLERSYLQKHQVQSVWTALEKGCSAPRSWRYCATRNRSSMVLRDSATLVSSNSISSARKFSNTRRPFPSTTDIISI